MSDVGEVFPILLPGGTQFGVFVSDRRGVPHVVGRQTGAGFGVSVSDRLEDVVVIALQGLGVIGRPDRRGRGAGGVVLDVTDPDGLRRAARRIIDGVAVKAGVVVDRVLVQPMAGAGVGEVLVGYRRSADVGPVVVLSTGGVTAEIYDDTAVRLAPVDHTTGARDDRRGAWVEDSRRVSRHPGW